MKADELKNTPPKIMIYGPAGSGKTGLVSQANKGYLFDFDGGMLTARNLNDSFSSLRKSIDFDVYRDTKPSNPDGWRRAKEKLISISEQCASNKWAYNACIIDSFTGLSQAIQNSVMANDNKPMGKPEIQHYGMIVSELEIILTLITSLHNTLVLVTAHEMPILSRKGQIGHPEQDTYKFVPLCAGTKLGPKLPWMFDEVWYADRTSVGGKIAFVVSGKPSSYNDSRTRSGFVEDFDHTSIGLAALLKKLNYNYDNK